jgi:hypothetical protein
MADVASKQQMTALFLSTILVVTRTRRHTELTKKNQGCDNTGCQIARTTKFCAVIFNTCESSDLGYYSWYRDNLRVERTEVRIPV